MRSPSTSRSITARSERPIRRWISTERPSRRPLEMSRALRSPVEAGSIPYSAVSQPWPLPVIQRGTPSCAEAVQMTRVSPIEIRAEPVAVRTNPGSISTGRRSPAARVAAFAHARHNHVRLRSRGLRGGLRGRGLLGVGAHLGPRYGEWLAGRTRERFMRALRRPAARRARPRRAAFAGSACRVPKAWVSPVHRKR